MAFHTTAHACNNKRTSIRCKRGESIWVDSPSPACLLLFIKAFMSSWTFRKRWISWWSFPCNFCSSLSIWISLNTRPWLESARKRVIWRKSRSLCMRGVNSMRWNEHTMQPRQQGQQRVKGNKQNQHLSEGFRFVRTSYMGGKTWVFVVKHDWKTNWAMPMCPSSLVCLMAHQIRPSMIRTTAIPVRI